MPKVTIEVTQNRIDEGEAGECLTCPIALGIKPHLADGCFPEVAGKEVSIRWTVSRRYVTIELPDEAKAFIEDFDEGIEPLSGERYLPVEPFTFELDIPEEYLRTQCTKQ